MGLARSTKTISRAFPTTADEQWRWVPPRGTHRLTRQMQRSYGRFNLELPPPIYIDSEQAARGLLQTLLRKVEIEPDDPIGYDTETHAMKVQLPSGKQPLDWMRDHITFWSMSVKLNGEFHRWCLRREDLHTFGPLLENPRTRLATWNLKYDAHVTWNSGLDLWCARPLDLMIAGYLFEENLQGDMGLKSRAADWCGLNMTPFKDLFAGLQVDGTPVKEFTTSLFELPIERVVDYASYDAYATLQLYYFLKEKLEALPVLYEDHESDLWQYFINIEAPFTRALWRMERRGMPVDREYLRAMIGPIEQEIARIEREIVRLAGAPINLNSPAQLAHFFFGPKDELGPVKASGTRGPIRGLGLEPLAISKKTRKPSTDEGVLNQLAVAGVPAAQLLLRVRKIGVILRTFARNLLALSEHHEDGRIHPSFNQYFARTGRLSASNPNVMNLPRPDNDEFKVRGAFIAPPGKKLLVLDYEQLEMRIMAHMSADPRMLRAIREGKDLHCFTVSLMWRDCTYEEAVEAKKVDKKLATPRQLELKERRQRAKTIGFGIIYGAQKKNIGEQLGIDPEEAQALIDAYFRVFPRIKHFIEDTIANCRNGWTPEGELWPWDDTPEAEDERDALEARGAICEFYVRTIDGRMRRLKEINHHEFKVRGHAEREAVNARIQGSAADLVKAAMVKIDRCPELNALGYEMISQVHDEIVGLAPEENAEACAPLLQEYMEHPFARGRDPMLVPTPVNTEICDRYSEAK